MSSETSQSSSLPEVQLPAGASEDTISEIQPIDPEISIKQDRPVPQAQGDVVIVFPKGISESELKQTPFPAQLLISAGDTVTWENKDVVGHAVTSGSPKEETIGSIFYSGLISPGNSFSHTFSNSDKTGDDNFVVYPYFCSVHPWMTGKIVVQFFDE